MGRPRAQPAAPGVGGRPQASRQESCFSFAAVVRTGHPSRRVNFSGTLFCLPSPGGGSLLFGCLSKRVLCDISSPRQGPASPRSQKHCPRS